MSTQLKALCFSFISNKQRLVKPGPFDVDTLADLPSVASANSNVETHF